MRCDFLVPSRASTMRSTRNPRTSRGGYRSCATRHEHLVGAITTVETNSTHGKFLLEPFDCAVAGGLSVLLCQGEHGVDLARIELPNDGLLVRRRLDAVKDFIGFFGGCALIISGSASRACTRWANSTHETFHGQFSASNGTARQLLSGARRGHPPPSPPFPSRPQVWLRRAGDRATK